MVRILKLLGFLLFACSIAHAQLTPASSCNDCDGAITLNFDPEITSINWLQNGISLGTVLTVGGQATILDLCPGSYDLALFEGANPAGNSSFNISVVGFNPGANQDLFFCENGAFVDLNTQLDAAADLGGIWTFNGVPVDPNIELAAINSGIYSYELPAAPCPTAAQLNVQINVTAFPGLTTTYLICENFEPFSMLTELNGDAILGLPDTGGFWLDSDGNPVDGIYTPNAGMEGFYQYIIDSVPGCPQVSSVLTVVEIDLANPGTYTDLFVCATAAPINLFDYLEGNPDVGGTWYNTVNAQFDGVYDPLNMPQGEYRYRVDGTSVCPQQQTFVNVQLTPALDPGQNAVVELCASQGDVALTDLLDGTPQEGGDWTFNGLAVGDLLDLNTAQNGVYTYSLSGVGCADEMSTVELTVLTAPFAGEDQSYFFCNDVGPVDLNDLLSPTSDLGGEWIENGTAIGNDFSFSGSNSNTFLYQLATPNCPVSEAQIEINWNAPAAVTNENPVLCSSQGTYDLLDAIAFSPSDASILFLDANNLPVNNTIALNTAGVFEFTVQVDPQNACPVVSAVVELTVNVPLVQNANETVVLCEDDNTIELDDWLFGFPEGGDWFIGGQNIGSPNFELLNDQSILQYAFENPAPCPNAQMDVTFVLIDRPDAGDDQVLNFCQGDMMMDLNDFLTADQNGTWTSLGQNVSNMLSIEQPDQLLFNYAVLGEGECPGDEAIFEVTISEIPQLDFLENITLCASDLPYTLGEELDPTWTYVWSSDMSLEDPTSPTQEVDVEVGQLPVSLSWNLDYSDGQCGNTQEVLLTVNPEEGFDIGFYEIACFGESFELAIPEGWELQNWLPNTANYDEDSNSLFGNIEASETWEITAVNSFGCEVQTDVFIDLSIPDQPVLSSSDFMGCTPFSGLLSLSGVGEGSTTYWFSGNEELAIGENLVLTDLIEGNYAFSAITENEDGCWSDSLTVEGVVYPSPEVDFSYSPQQLSVVQPQVNFENLSTDVVAYEWDFGGEGQSQEEHPTFVFNDVQDAFYEVCLTGLSEEGCLSTHCEVLEFPGEIIVHVPNAFTPDGDGFNEVFHPVIFGEKIEAYQFWVYDRWGETIFYSEDINDVWTGEVRNGEFFVAPGVYSWRVLIQTSFEIESVDYIGQVTVIR